MDVVIYCLNVGPFALELCCGLFSKGFHYAGRNKWLTEYDWTKNKKYGWTTNVTYSMECSHSKMTRHLMLHIRLNASYCQAVCIGRIDTGCYANDIHNISVALYTAAAAANAKKTFSKTHQIIIFHTTSLHVQMLLTSFIQFFSVGNCKIFSYRDIIHTHIYLDIREWVILYIGRWCRYMNILWFYECYKHFIIHPFITYISFKQQWYCFVRTQPNIIPSHSDFRRYYYSFENKQKSIIIIMPLEKLWPSVCIHIHCRD